MQVSQEAHDVTSSPSSKIPLFVPETRFGVWFLGTDTWFNFVLRAALEDLYRLMGERQKSYPTIVDVGCGQGRSFRMLKILFRPTRLVGLDFEEQNIRAAKKRCERDRVKVDFLQNDCAAIDLPDESADMVLCHQTFHHLVEQEKCLGEFRRILKPGGVLLFAESTRAYIHSWIIRLLFAHPMHVQRTADEYIAMVRDHGFEFERKNISFPYLWWSRWDFGFLERLGIRPKPIGQREETLVNFVARKPVSRSVRG